MAFEKMALQKIGSDKPAGAIAFEKWLCRNEGVINKREQLLLKNSKIIVAGVGGVGGICAEMLVRAGVGNIAVIDFDRFEISNLNRQLHSTRKNIGKGKADEFLERAKSINPKIKITTFKKKLDINSFDYYVGAVGKCKPKIVIDTFDNAPSRAMLFRICKKLKIAYIYAGAAKSRGMVSIFCVQDDMEKILRLPSYKKPVSGIKSSLANYPRRPPVWGAGTNLAGILASNACLNYLLKKQYPRAPNFWMSDAFEKKIVRMEKI